MVSTEGSVDLARLMKLRLVVAKYGEMDLASWWNTRGMLGRLGGMALKRGFPHTHSFAQARVVFAVARQRCKELFDPPQCMTLWQLPPEVEEQFEEAWHDFLDDQEKWGPFFEALQGMKVEDELLDILANMDLLDPQQATQVKRMSLSAEGKAVQVPEVHEPNDEILGLLAGAFSLGAKGKPALPYARI